MILLPIISTLQAISKGWNELEVWAMPQKKASQATKKWEGKISWKCLRGVLQHPKTENASNGPKNPNAVPAFGVGVLVCVICLKKA